jgi:mRNA interferase MazF
MGMVVTQFDVFLVALDPTIGSEIQKTRPCLVISPNEMNKHLATAIVAPMTTKGKPYPSRIPIHFQGKDGLIVLDQIRTVDKIRLVKKLGSIDDDDRKAVTSLLVEMFAEG